MRYERNRIYTRGEEMQVIKNTGILIAGCGIGSNIAECALRFGFEKITVVDGDTVELSNLSHQNYTQGDIGRYKSEVLAERLRAINPDAEINFSTKYITHDNLDEFLGNYKIAVNALDFSTDIPLVFDRKFQKNGTYILHPYNLGWEALVTIITPDGLNLDYITAEDGFSEQKMVEYVTGYLRFWNMPEKWLEEVLKKYKEERGILPPPQLSIASWLIAGVCTKIMYQIATGRSVRRFPEFYLTKNM